MNNRENRLLFIYTETPLHAGSGRGLGYVDLPIQREQVTSYPMIQSSSLKGRLRAEVRRKKGWYQNGEDTAELKAIFGDADDGGNSYAGAVTPGDARLLLLPVRSLQGVFAWVTSLDVLNRFRRDMTALGFNVPDWQLPESDPQPEDDETTCYAGGQVTFQKKVTLEEFTYRAKEHSAFKRIGEWLAQNALPQNDDYKYWRDNLPGHLVILPREDFRDFAQFGTEVRTHIRIEPDTKTVAGPALWTVESLPSDTLLYAPLVINDSRAELEKQSARDIAGILHTVLHDQRKQLGGHETTGQGVVMLHFCNPTEDTNG
jgi:CRISPR-associated protein Cmr4